MGGICVNVVNPVHFFPIPQGTLPWQLILGQICEMTFIQHTGILKRIRISQFGFRGLLGTQVIEGDTMAPSGLYARLCHAFLVNTCHTVQWRRSQGESIPLISPARQWCWWYQIIWESLGFGTGGDISRRLWFCFDRDQSVIYTIASTYFSLLCGWFVSVFSDAVWYSTLQVVGPANDVMGDRRPGSVPIKRRKRSHPKSNAWMKKLWTNATR